MTKDLSDMTLAELWELFPIILAPPDEKRYAAVFFAEKQRLSALLREKALSVLHVGSTAIGTIRSKPIVDIIVETDDQKGCAALLAAAGYIVMSESGDRISLNKGYTPCGYTDEVFHIHLRRKGDADEKYFCRYLKETPDEAKRYEALKERLLAIYGKDRDGYTAAKTGYVTSVTRKAKALYEK